MAAPVTHEGRFGSGNATPITISGFATAQTDYILLLVVYNEHTGTAAATVSSVTSAGMTWALRRRSNSSTTGGLELWWAHGTSTATYNVTINMSGTFDICVAGVICVTGCANPAAPFDTNVGLPKAASAPTTTWTPSFTNVSTSSTDDLLLFLTGSEGVTAGPPSGFTLALNPASGSGGWAAAATLEVQAVTALQTSATFTRVGSTSAPFGAATAGEAIFDSLVGSLPALIGTQVFLTSGTTWTVPSDWNNAANTIECIGGGGAGGSSNGSGPASSSGGGGGAYAIASNISLTVASVINIQIGQAGAAGSSGTNGGAGTDSIFDTSLNTVIAKAGGGGFSNGQSNKGAGGLAASCTPSTGAHSGGDGNALPNANGFGGGGGGGAGGLHGAGGNGAASNATSTTNGNGGGASDGGGAGFTVVSTGGSSTGGAGGTAQDGTLGGAGGVSANGSPGSHGSGGGGAGGGAGSPIAGGAGGAGIGYIQTSDSAVAGPGGGGGGGGSSAGAAQTVGGAGGLYGAGGGGANYGAGTRAGAGAQGIIVVTYAGSGGSVQARAMVLA